MKKIIISCIMLASMLFATEVTFQGNKVELNSSGLSVGDKAPAFNVVKNNLTEVSLGGNFSGTQILAFVVSIDTGTCSLESKKFNKELSTMKNIKLYVISKDLPFAQKRFCESAGIKNVEVVSDFKDSNNAKRYGATITAPANLEGYFARMVYILKDGKVTYKQIVPEIADEPNYKEILNNI